MTTLHAELRYTPATPEYMTVDGVRIELEPQFAAFLKLFRWGGMEDAFLSEMRPYLKAAANKRREEIKNGVTTTETPFSKTL